MTNRRNHLTPPDDAPSPDGMHAMRRGGARREVSTRVFLKKPDGEGVLEGWALNVSRGGVRAILEEKVELGQEFEVEVGTGDGPPRNGRIVWMQEEPDGVIVGVEFTSLSGTHKSVPPASPSGRVPGPESSVTDVATKAADSGSASAPDAAAAADPGPDGDSGGK